MNLRHHHHHVYVLVGQDEEEAGPLEQLRTQICDNVALYAQKYDEEFGPYLPRFVQSVWTLLANTGMQVKYDLVSRDSGRHQWDAGV